MFRRSATITLFVSALLAVPAWAFDLGPGAHNLSVLDPYLSGSSDVNFNVDATLVVDVDESRIGTISVASGVAAVIDFGAASHLIRFRSGPALITLGSGATLTIQGGAPGAGFDFAALNPAGGQTLTINGPLTGAVAGNTIWIGNNTLATGASAVALHHVNATAGRISAGVSLTITALAAHPGSGQSFTCDVGGPSAIAALDPLGNGEVFIKSGSGALTVASGFGFGAGSGVQLSITAGAFIDAGGAGIVLGDDAEKITVASGAVYTTSSSITGHSGASSNLDAATGSTVNFAANGPLTLTSAADDDFKLLGTVNIQNGCALHMAGAFRSQFGSVNVADTCTWTNTVPNSTMLLAPGSTLSLKGPGSGLVVDGQAMTSRITVSTTTGGGNFTIDRGSSSNMTFKNVGLSNCTYASDAGGKADQELSLVNLRDDGQNVNWFTVVPLAANAGPDKSIFAGRSTTLDGSGGGGSGGYLFSWSPATGLSAADVPAPVASPSETTIYTLTVTDAASTSILATDQVTVTVNTAVLASAGPDKQGTGYYRTDTKEYFPFSTTLEGSASGGSGHYAFSWSPETGLDNPSIATPTATCYGSQEITYTLTVTDLGDDNRTATDQVTVSADWASVTDPNNLCGSGFDPARICGAGLPLSMFPVTLLGLFGLKFTTRGRRPG